MLCDPGSKNDRIFWLGLRYTRELAEKLHMRLRHETDALVDAAWASGDPNTVRAAARVVTLRETIELMEKYDDEGSTNEDV